MIPGDDAQWKPRYNTPFIKRPLWRMAEELPVAVAGIAECSIAYLPCIFLVILGEIMMLFPKHRYMENKLWMR
jgi:hypothetical protein